eukprot:8307764-Alexandrium_andersonii.AAC.1
MASSTRHPKPALGAVGRHPGTCASVEVRAPSTRQQGWIPAQQGGRGSGIGARGQHGATGNTSARSGPLATTAGTGDEGACFDCVRELQCASANIGIPCQWHAL